MNDRKPWFIKVRLVYIAVIALLSAVGIWYLSYCTCHADNYNEYVFQPWQLIRNSFLRHIHLSIGDIMYCCWGLSILIFLVRVIVCLLYWSELSERLKYIVVKGLASLAGIYLFFMIGWGGNYYKEPLETFWGLGKAKWNDSTLVEFDKYLVEQLNATAPHYKTYDFNYARKKAEALYKSETDCANNGKGLHIKASLFGNWMKYMGVQGYYNPFTGESQVNKYELPFLLPYIITHELAHQSGVGAEDDANLLAYVVSMRSNDSTFMYSAYFSVWLYTHAQVRMRDTMIANEIRKELNPISLRHIEEMRRERRKYRSKFSRYTGDVYDQYLKLNHQRDGIESYDKVTVSAWAWQQKQLRERESKVYIP